MAGITPGIRVAIGAGPLEPSAAAAGRWMPLDAVQLGGQVGHVADVSIAEDVGKAERALRSRDLDDRGDIDVAMGHQLASPVAVGMDLWVSRRGAGYAGDDEGGQ
jgi:hypothetical protein